MEMMCTIQGSRMRVTEMFHGRQLTDECVQKVRVRKAKERLEEQEPRGVGRVGRRSAEHRWGLEGSDGTLEKCVFLHHKDTS